MAMTNFEINELLDGFLKSDALPQSLRARLLKPRSDAYVTFLRLGILPTNINLTFRSLIACATLALLVTGCENRNSSSVPVIAANSPGTTSAPVADKWIGRWSGPEGTFLQLAGGNGKYEVTIQNLDGPRTFQGSAGGNQVAFERNGVKERLN